MNSMIEISGLSAKYDAEPVLENVSFTVEQGDYLCIVGTNGSGKSTLLKAMLGLVKPISGKVVFEGVSGTQMGYLPQQNEAQRDFPTSVFEVVLSGCAGRKGLRLTYSRVEKNLAKETLHRLGAEDLARRAYRELSVGQRQRILLARALCATEKILLLDEPAGGLDPMMSAELYDLLAELHDSGVTIVMVSHDIPSAVRHGTKILHLDKEIIFYGAAADYPASDIGKCMCGGCTHEGESV